MNLTTRLQRLESAARVKQQALAVTLPPDAEERLLRKLEAAAHDPHEWEHAVLVIVGVLLAHRGEAATRVVLAQWPAVTDVDEVIVAAQTLRRASGDKWPRTPYARYDSEDRPYAA